MVVESTLPVENSTTTTTDVPLAVSIDEIDIQADGSAVVRGRASIGEGGLSATIDIVYVVDLSGSTSSDCGGSSPPGSDILDCEKIGLEAFNDSLKPFQGLVNVGLVGFGSRAEVANVMPPPGPGSVFTGPATDDNANGVADIDEVVDSLARGTVGEFTTRSVSTGTDFDDALSATAIAFGSSTTPTRRAIFLSDGQSSVDTGAGSPLESVVALGVVVDTYAIGTGAANQCDPGAELRTIADETGGTCTVVSDPSTLAADLGAAKPAGIDRVEVTYNGLNLLADLDFLGNWVTTIPDVGSGGTVVATAFADEGTSVAVAADIGEVVEVAEVVTEQAFTTDQVQRAGHRTVVHTEALPFTGSSAMPYLALGAVVAVVLGILASALATGVVRRTPRLWELPGEHDAGRHDAHGSDGRSALLLGLGLVAATVLYSRTSRRGGR